MMNKLLIIRFSALGDVAMLVPVVRNLAEQNPQLDITMLSRKQTAPLFRSMPSNVHFFGADLKGEHHGIRGLNLLLKQLDYTQFDAVADMHGVLRSVYLRMRCLLAGKRVVHICKGRFSKWRLVHRCYHHRTTLPTTISRYEEVLKQLGFPLRYNPTPTNSPSPLQSIGIAPFAAHKGKIYPLDKMEQVVQKLGQELSKEGEKVFLFGAGEHEKAILASWEKYPGVESLAGKNSMDNEIEIMSHLRLMLTMDSANMHLASLAGTRVISIWGATHPDAGFLGYGQSLNDCIQKDLPCRPCSIYGNKPCRYHDWRCLNIEPEEINHRVLTAIEQ